MAALGIQVGSGSDEVRIDNCSFVSVGSDAVDVTGDSCVVVRNTFRDVTGDAINLNAGADSTILNGNLFDTITGSDVNDAGTYSSADRVLVRGVGDINFGAAEKIVINMGGQSWPLPPNGSRRFIVKCRLNIEFSGTVPSIDLRIRAGTTGAIGDAIIKTWTYTTPPTDPSPTNLLFGPFIVKPAVSTKFAVTIDVSVGANHDMYAMGVNVATNWGEFQIGNTSLQCWYLDG